MTYIIEEPNEEPQEFNDNNEKITYVNGFEYSNIQRLKFKKVLKQLSSVWWDTYNHIRILRETDIYLTIEDSNFIMNKIHKLFIIHHKSRVDFYNEDKIRHRKNKNFLKNKINKMRNLKQKI